MRLPDDSEFILHRLKKQIEPPSLLLGPGFNSTEPHVLKKLDHLHTAAPALRGKRLMASRLAMAVTLFRKW